MRQPKQAPKRGTMVHFTILRLAGSHYGRVWFHRHPYMSRMFVRPPRLLDERKFSFQEARG